MYDYEVGYGRPPKATQFKPGQSGNPRGRKKESKSLETIVAKLLDTKVTVETPNGAKRVTKREAITMKLIHQALAGDLKAINVLLPIIAKNDERNAQINKMLEDLSAEDNEILKGFINEKSDAVQTTSGDIAE